MTVGGKRVLLGLALLASVVAAWFAPTADGDGVVLTQHAASVAASRAAPTPDTLRPISSAPARSVAVAAIDVRRIRAREQGEPGTEAHSRLFAARQWRAPVKPLAPASVVAPPAPAAPQAPPLPFRVLGRYDDAGETTVFVQHFEQALVLRVGDTIAEQYKVESLQGSTLTLRYLPLNQTQTLEVGGSK
jgi:hypothetical protein